MVMASCLSPTCIRMPGATTAHRSLGKNVRSRTNRSATSLVKAAAGLSARCSGSASRRQMTTMSMSAMFRRRRGCGHLGLIGISEGLHDAGEYATGYLKAFTKRAAERHGGRARRTDGRDDGIWTMERVADDPSEGGLPIRERIRGSGRSLRLSERCRDNQPDRRKNKGMCFHRLNSLQLHAADLQTFDNRPEAGGTLAIATEEAYSSVGASSSWQALVADFKRPA